MASAEEAARSKNLPDRVLNGHYFVPLRTVDWAFVGTRAGLFLGGGLTRFVADESNTLDPEFFEDLEAAFLEQRAHLQIGVFDWLAIGAAAQLDSVVGTDVPSAIEFGGHASGTFLGDVAVRVVRTERLQLGGRVQAGFLTGAGVVPSRLVRTAEVREDDTIVFERGSVTVDADGTLVRPAVTAAYALGPALGFQASAAYAWRSLEIFGRDEDVQEVALAIGATFDAREVLLPAAVAGAYRLTIPVDPATDLVHDAEVGLYYSGVANLNVGAALQVALRDADAEGIQERVAGWLQMNYFW
jgi:hypothetical protein